jgi:hypothetical protein
MHAAAILLAAAAVTAPAAEVTTFDGRTVGGGVAALDGKAVVLDEGGQKTTLPLENVLEVKFPTAGDRPAESAAELELRLRDGGRLGCRQAVTKDRSLVADTAALGDVTFPLSAVQAIRFRPSDPAVEAKWTELLGGTPEKDLLVVRNGDVLDRLEGTVSGLDAENLTFLVGENRVAIPRSKEKLFGVIFGRAEGAKPAAVAELRLRGGDRLPVSKLSLSGESLAAATTSGQAVTVPLGAVESIDFGGGKVQFLSKLPPRETQNTTYFGDEPLFVTLADRSFEGPNRPIRIDRQAFRSGLVVRSRTKLTWRLGGEFRRFVAVAGIEQYIRNTPAGGVVDLTISADGKTLFNRRVTKTDPPIPLDLDVSGARELTVFVDFGGDMDDGDHLALGDARLIK